MKKDRRGIVTPIRIPHAGRLIEVAVIYDYVGKIIYIDAIKYGGEDIKSIISPRLTDEIAYFLKLKIERGIV